MAQKLNCWEIKNCGREQGGAKVNEFGICPAATKTSSHGINGGINGGRICWAIAGTYCDDIQGTHAQESASCLGCGFLYKVLLEEGSHFKFFAPDQEEELNCTEH
jgi:hypothetical protein